MMRAADLDWAVAMTNLLGGGALVGRNLRELLVKLAETPGSFTFYMMGVSGGARGAA